MTKMDAYYFNFLSMKKTQLEYNAVDVIFGLHKLIDKELLIC